VGLVDIYEAFPDTVYSVSLSRKIHGRHHKRPKILKGGRKERLCPRYLICGRPGTKDFDVILLSTNDVRCIYIPFIKETDGYDADAFGLFYWTVSISELDIILKCNVSLTLSPRVHHWKCCGSLPERRNVAPSYAFSVSKQCRKWEFANADHCYIEFFG
jgi:hypothetical protein